MCVAVRLRALARVVAVCVVVAGGGCRFGEARFTSSVPGVGFDPGGTVFSYLDERDANLVEDSDPRVAVALTWVVFDAQGDLSDLDGAALASMAHEMSLRDALSLVFDHQGAVDVGEEFRAVREGDELVETDGLDFTLHLAPERLDATSTFADIAPFASRRTVEVAVDTASFDDAAPVVAGSVAITFEAVPGRDPGKAREGTFEGTFRAPLVPEPVAEKNLALLAGAVDGAGVLGLPLPPRDAEAP